MANDLYERMEAIRHSLKTEKMVKIRECIDSLTGIIGDYAIVEFLAECFKHFDGMEKQILRNAISEGPLRLRVQAAVREVEVAVMAAKAML